MRTCLIPLRIEIRKPSINLDIFEQKLKEISTYRPDIVCLPECAFTGYLFDGQDFLQFAEPIPGPITAKISVLAKEHLCYICFGLLESTPEGIYSSAVLIDKAGKIVLVHRKIAEQPPFLNGDRVKTFETEFGRVSILVCGDLFHDEVRAKIECPLNILLVPMARCFAGTSPDINRWLNEERQIYLDEVKKVGVPTILVNALENASSEASFCGAMIVDRNGEILAESPHGTDEAIIFDINMDDVNDNR